MKLYDELAEWWPLFSAPADYAEEAAFFARLLTDACKPAPRTVLELGSGGGNNALYLKSKFQMTLVDLSSQMLAVSRKLNPECEHREGDMRTVNLGRTFDAVFVHDAIAYMTNANDLGAAISTAYRHCRAGGVALFVPDCVRETFAAETKHSGHDGDGRSLRYLMWVVDPDPTDTTYRTDFAIMLRDRNGDTRVVHDSHLEGMFPRAEWMRLLSEAGFEPRSLTDEWGREIFVAKRPR
ncbi:MAG TPA: class I SAM-dependent methyltransferase [Candidatus Binatus sp.]|nr:class I SAM-dependent methyltransferase [Candidatus Binatus sp.]